MASNVANGEAESLQVDTQVPTPVAVEPTLPVVDAKVHSSREENITIISATSRSRQNLIMIMVPLTQLVQFWPYGTGILGAVSIATSLFYKDPYSTQIVAPEDKTTIAFHAAWIAASYPLTNGTFILMSGRLGEIYGHWFVMMVGCCFWVIWHLGSGFANNVIALCFMRGLSGAGGALIVTNAVALLGITFPPGRRRNLAMGTFGAMAPIGAGIGCVVTGLLIQLSEWKWAYFILTIMGLVVFGLSLYLVPRDTPADPQGHVDWFGAYIGIAGLILFNFVWNQAPAVGWSTPYIYSLFIVALGHFGAFACWEIWGTNSPILPFDIWKSPSFGRLLVLISCSFMSLGIYLWYYTIFGLNIRHYSVIEQGANTVPLTILGGVAAFVATWLVPRVPAQFIIALGNVALVVCNVLLATTPRHQTWWAMMMPSQAIDAFSVDLIFAASQIIASGSVGRKNQGVAGSLIGTLQTYGLSTGLGFAGTVEAYTNKGGTDLLAGYRHALYLAIGLAGIGAIGSLLFLRIPKNTKEGWDEEDHMDEYNNAQTQELVAANEDIQPGA